MTLAASQRAFLDQVLDEHAPAPSGWTGRTRLGMEIYRNAYRTRLVDALGETFPAVKTWVGDEPFARAAAHHVIVNPPSSWSLDQVGAGFDATLADLFAEDPEVAELAWLEWQMHLAFVARDAAPLDHAGFAGVIARTDPERVGALRLATTPGLALRTVAHDIPAIWRSATGDGDLPGDYALAQPSGLAVWREGLRPVFRTTSPDEAACLALAAASASFGDICEALADRMGDEGVAAPEAGAMLARWIGDGMIAAIESR